MANLRHTNAMVISLLVSSFLFAIYALCGDVLATSVISCDFAPELFVRIVRQCCQMPMTVISVVVLSLVVQEFSRHGMLSFARMEKRMGKTRKWIFVWCLILAAAVVGMEALVENTGVIYEIGTRFMSVGMCSFQVKSLVLALGYRICGAVEGGLLMLIFVRSNPRLTNMLFCVYGVVAVLLMLVRLPVA